MSNFNATFKPRWAAPWFIVGTLAALIALLAFSYATASVSNAQTAHPDCGAVASVASPDSLPAASLAVGGFAYENDEFIVRFEGAPTIRSVQCSYDVTFDGVRYQGVASVTQRVGAQRAAPTGSVCVVSTGGDTNCIPAAGYEYAFASAPDDGGVWHRVTFG